MDAITPTYEPGMKIEYDPVTHRVVIAFRGRISVLPGSVETKDEAISAGERFCRQNGWKPEDSRKTGSKLRSAWR